MTIQILNEITINKIAAGEVVERPLNIVKELVENSLDAGAADITVEIQKAGRQLIRVNDNGCGMDKDDLQLCIERHATNKIASFEDLENINSLGFRGEALPSVAAVSMLNIKTKRAYDPSGWQISVEGGKKSSVLPWSGADGTIVEVLNLFFNTPVREKFLKSDTTEKSKIINCLDEIALVRNDVAFKIISDGKVIANYKKTDSKLSRIQEVLGKDISEKLKFVFNEHPKIQIEAFITPRNNALSQKKLQYLFVNGRCVNYPKWLIHAVYQAYKQLIPVDKHPGVVIFINSVPSDIDVNIHPAKREIKFSNENQMYDLFYNFIKSSIESDGPSAIVPRQSSEAFDNKNYKQNKEKSSAYFTNEKNYIKRQPSISEYANLYSANVPQKTEQKIVKPSPEAAIRQNIIENDIYRFVGQIFETYVIAEGNNELLIIDQHASEERIKYELFCEQLLNKKLAVQHLLVPEIFDLPASHANILKEKFEIFNSLGFNIEEFGANTFRLMSYPAILETKNSLISVIKNIVDIIIDEKTIDIDELNEKIIRTACRASIKAGDTIAHSEAVRLIKDIFSCKNPFTCPHGRPTMYKITHNELEKFFKRK